MGSGRNIPVCQGFLIFNIYRRSNLFTPSGKGKGEEKRAGELGSGRNIPVRQDFLII